MEKRIPVNLLTLLEKWFANGVTCVKWGPTFSGFSVYCAVYGKAASYHRLLFIDSVVDKVAELHILHYIVYICW